MNCSGCGGRLAALSETDFKACEKCGLIDDPRCISIRQATRSRLLEVFFGIAVIVFTVGFVYTISQIPKELRGGIYKQITDYYIAIDERADRLELTFDKQMMLLDKKQNEYLKQMEDLCLNKASYSISQTSLQTH